MGTAIKHPVPDRVKPSFVIFDIPERQSARMSKITNDGFALFCSYMHFCTVFQFYLRLCTCHLVCLRRRLPGRADLRTQIQCLRFGHRL